MATALRPIAHEERLSLVEHLDELRTRILICLAAFVVAGGLCWWQNDRVLEIMDRPLAKSAFSKGSEDPFEQAAAFQQSQKQLYLQFELFGRALSRSGDLSPELRRQAAALSEQASRTAAAAPRASPRRPVTLGVGEPFTATFRVVAYAALLISLPLILFQAYAFVLPAFSPRERQVALPAMLGIPFLFIGGVVFGYFMVVPRAIQFLQNFNADAFDVLIQAQPYYKFVIMLLVAMGLLFQIPVGIVAITRVGIVSTSQLAHNRRYAILAIAVAAMLLPGQDPITMGMMMAPMYVLFEASILFSWLLDRRAGRAAPEDLEDLEDSEPVTTDQD